MTVVAREVDSLFKGLCVGLVGLGRWSDRPPASLSPTRVASALAIHLVEPSAGPMLMSWWWSWSACSWSWPSCSWPSWCVVGGLPRRALPDELRRTGHSWCPRPRPDGWTSKVDLWLQLERGGHQYDSCGACCSMASSTAPWEASPVEYRVGGGQESDHLGRVQVVKARHRLGSAGDGDVLTANLLSPGTSGDRAEAMTAVRVPSLLALLVLSPVEAGEQADRAAL